jgi:hypothetical protein
MLQLTHSLTFSDLKLAKGIDMQTFNAAVDSFVTKSFKFETVVSEIVRHEYTVWQHQPDPIELRDQYVKVSNKVSML